jgi:Putative peptidoglycan binding domain
LREALGAADHDFTLTEPASKMENLREKLLTACRRRSRWAGRRGRHHLSILAIGVFIAAAAAILLNALLWQRTRHPAPFFSRAGPAAPIVVPLPRLHSAVAAIQAQDKPVEKPAAQRSPVEMPPLETPTNGQPRQSGLTSSPPYDEISRLLTAPPEPPARPTTKAATSAAPSKLVLAVQRALVKLGFVLNPDGVAGPLTRQAIERYERDHGMPVSGDLSPAIARKLSAETGIAIN